MSSLLITHGRVIDPSQDMDRVTNLLIENGKIAAFDIATPLLNAILVTQAMVSDRPKSCSLRTRRHLP